MEYELAHASRIGILKLLAGLAVGDPDPIRGFDVQLPADRSALEAREGGVVTYEAVRQALPQLAVLFADRDASVRSATAFLFALFADRALELLPLVRKAIHAESDVVARTSLLLSLRLLARHAATPDDLVDLDRRLAEATSPSPDTVAAAIARLELGGAQDRAIAVLANAKAMKQAPGFFWGDIREIGKWIVDGFGMDDPLDSLIAEIENPATDKARCWRIAVHVLPRYRRGRRNQATVLPDEIAPVERRLLVACARRNLLNASSLYDLLEDCGWPPPHDHKYWLGLETRPFERSAELDGRSWPVWRWMQAALLREVPIETAATAVANGLSVEERVSLIYPPTDAGWGYRTSYELSRAVDSEGPEDNARIKATEARLDDLAGQILRSCGRDRLVVLGRRFLASKEFHERPTLIALGYLCEAGGESFPTELLPLWERYLEMCEPLRAGFASLPLTLREKILLEQGMFAQDVRQRGAGGRMSTRTVFFGGWTVADLCPTPAWAEKLALRLAGQHVDRLDEVTVMASIAEKLGSVLAAPLEKELANPKMKKSPRRPILQSLLERLRAKRS